MKYTPSLQNKKAEDESSQPAEVSAVDETASGILGTRLNEDADILRGVFSASRIGIWGLTGSGKTTYILSLREAMEKKGWRVRPTPDTRPEYARENQRMNSGHYPRPTAIPRLLEFVFSMKGKWFQKGEFITVGLPDVPGISYLEHDFVYDYLSACDGIIFLIDLEEKWRGETGPYGEKLDDIGHIITDYLDRLRETTDTDVVQSHIAFCTPKMDIYRLSKHLKENDLRRQEPCKWEEDHPYEVAESILGKRVMETIEGSTDYARVEWFTCSVVDCYEENGVLIPQHYLEDTIPRIRRPRERFPKRVEEPIEWLFKQL